MQRDTERPTPGKVSTSSWLIFGAIAGAVVIGVRWWTVQPSLDWMDAPNPGPYQLGLAVCAVLLIVGVILRGQENQPKD